MTNTVKTSKNWTLPPRPKPGRRQPDLNIAINLINQENFDLKVNLLSLINDYKKLKNLVLNDSGHKRCYSELEQEEKTENIYQIEKMEKLTSKINLKDDYELGSANEYSKYMDFESDDEYDHLSRTTSPGSEDNSLMSTITRSNTELSQELNLRLGSLMNLPEFDEGEYSLKFDKLDDYDNYNEFNEINEEAEKFITEGFAI